jgi:hypothetical protein
VSRKFQVDRWTHPSFKKSNASLHGSEHRFHRCGVRPGDMPATNVGYHEPRPEHNKQTREAPGMTVLEKRT